MVEPVILHHVSHEALLGIATLIAVGSFTLGAWAHSFYQRQSTERIEAATDSGE